MRLHQIGHCGDAGHISGGSAKDSHLFGRKVCGIGSAFFEVYPTDDTRVNELLLYFKNSDPFYETQNFPKIVERVRYFKVKKEGVTIMCEIADRIRREGREGREEGRQETDLELLGRWLRCAARSSGFAEFEINSGMSF